LKLAQEALKFFRTQKSDEGTEMQKEADTWLRERGVKAAQQPHAEPQGQQSLPQ